MANNLKLPRASLRVAAACVVAAAFSTPAFANSPKRGMGGGTAGQVDAVNASWYYNWGLTPAAGTSRAEFTPMYWNYISQSSSTSVKNNPAITTVLGFNEPERTDQANLTVDQAIGMWPLVVATGKYVVSPAVSDGGNGRPWLTSFMAAASAANLKVDAVAFHWYGDIHTNPTQGAANFLGAVDWYHNQWNKPVWITEFGGLYNGATLADNKTFLSIVLPALDSRSYVGKYAYWNWSAQTKIIEDTTPYAPASPLGDLYTGTSFVTGTTFDLNGKAILLDKYYLKGGTITDTGTGRNSDSLQFLDVVSGVSTITANNQRWDITGAGGLLTLRAGTTLQKTGTGIVSLNGIGVSFDGTLDVQGGTLQVEGGTTFTTSRNTLLKLEPGSALNLAGTTAATAITLGGTVELRGGVVRASYVTQTLLASSTLFADTEFNVGAQLDVTGYLGGTGKLTKTGSGALRLASVNGYAGGTLVSAGALWLDSASTSSVTGAGIVGVASTASLIGNGSIDGATSIAGTVSPGGLNSTTGGSSLRFKSTLALHAGAHTVLDLGSSSDTLAITGAATLAGVLDLRTGATFDTTLGNSIPLVTAGSYTGQFDTITGVSLDSTSSLAVTYGAAGVQLTVARSGDATLDGVVNFDDLLLLAQQYGSTGRSWVTGDFNGSGSTDFDDLLILAQQYGAGAAATEASFTGSFGSDWALAIALTPEPATLGAMMLVLPLAKRRRTR